MIIKRDLQPIVLNSSTKYPVITITGPRQSGKTTLIRSTFPDYPYLSMEAPDERERALSDPRGLFSRFGNRLIIDEIQQGPPLLSYIQDVVDNDRQASFIISGSQNMLMMASISQSLAGRTSIFYQLPLSLNELSGTDWLWNDWTQHLWTGFYPRIFDRKLNPAEFYGNYLETYVNRDVRQIKNIGNLSLFSRFISICAGSIGQTTNYSLLANLTGVSLQTVLSWLSILEASFIIYRLEPYHRNFNKRLVKSAKIYFYDTGLACTLLRIYQQKDLPNYFRMGVLFENFVINEIIKSYYNQGLRPPVYFWQDNKGHEIDLILDVAGRLVPIEIKAGKTFGADFFKNLAWFQNTSDVPVAKSIVLYGGDQDWEMEYGYLWSWKKLIQWPLHWD